VRYALLLLAALTASSGRTTTAEAASPPPAGWLGLGYTYNVTNTSTGRVVWLFVRQIAPRGPADRAGVKPQDLITGINSKKISFKDELETLNFFTALRQGQRVQLEVRRGRNVLTFTIVADAVPPEMAKRRLINENVAKAQAVRK
jgi:C-terminal processing protease CtpA/Prc